MTTQHTQQVKELFADAIEMSEEERAVFLNSIDSDLAAEVSSLLTSHKKAGEFLSPPHIFPSSDNTDEQVGKHVGSYMIVREIAQGGMGEVYEAVRDDGVFDKQVAIKLVRHSMSRAELSKRFELERRTLAQLDHPNIAQLLDGGTSQDGVPYLVMEFVDGKRIDEYCDEQRLPIEKRLSLFLTVCTAVQYAHHRLIVHRDLKPSNILITTAGDPKLLDFGIAKLLTNDGAHAKQEITRTGSNIFTPEYASPEQVRGEAVTTASDVYSLAILLYKLLTGQKPYEFKSTLPHDIITSILESEPAKPSSMQPLILTSESKESIRRMLTGDLDNILLMALRKEHSRRYSSVEQFSGDLRRYLQGLPVTASRNSMGYRLSKFVKRNHAVVVAGMFILVSLFGGLAATLYQVQVVQKERGRAESTNSFLKKMIGYTNPMRRLPGSKEDETTMKEVLDEAARRIESGELADQPEIQAELEQIIGESYGYQGRYDLWERHQRNYISIQERLYGQDDPRTLDAVGTWAGILARKGDMKEAERLYRETLAKMRLARRDGKIEVDILCTSLNNFAYLRRTQGDSKEAEALFREMLHLSPMLPQESRHMIGVTRSTLASVLADQGRFDEALTTSREAVEECQRLGTTTTPDYGFVLTVFGGFLTEKGMFVAADSVLSAAETIIRRLQSPSSLWLGDNLRNQAMSFYQQGKMAAALLKVEETLKIYRESFGTHYDHYPTALSIQGLVLTNMGKPTEGENVLREAVKLRVVQLPKGHYFTALAQSALGDCLTMQKRFAEAEPLLLESYEDLKHSQGEDNPRTQMAKRRVYTLFTKWQKPEFAMKYQQ